MTPDDPRHGSEAGREQHVRDNETPCDACTHADILASRRRSKRRSMGHEFTRPIGSRLHAELVDLRAKGARLEDIAEWAGISDSQVHRIIVGGPTQRVYARTWLAVNNMHPRHIVTPIGTQRRLRALAWLGWSPAAIAERCGLHPDTIGDIRDAGITSSAKTRETIAAVFDELAMQPPPGDTVTQRRAAGLVRSVARRKGYVPPLAWTNIDDPAERPNVRNVRPLKTDIDPVVVQRVLGGDRLPTTHAEKVEITRRWEEQGRSLNDLERLMGWRSDRYTVRGEGAA